MIAVAFNVDKKEVKRATKIREDYYREDEEKEKRLESIMKSKRKEVRKYVDSLSLEELKENLYRRMINSEYDIAYKDIYGEDEW